MLDDGKIVEYGSHQELLQQRPGKTEPPPGHELPGIGKQLRPDRRQGRRVTVLQGLVELHGILELIAL